MPLSATTVKAIARAHGFELAGIADASPAADFVWYQDWVDRGLAAAMGYLADHRMQRRADPRELLPSAKSILCVGKLYHTPEPLSTQAAHAEAGWISRYAWGSDYHDIVRDGLRKVESSLRQESEEPFESRICVDTAPLLERSYARLAGLGWIGKNTCLIHEQTGSWYFLGELLLSVPLRPDGPPPDRCGSCTRCIDACPTAAIVPVEGSRDHRHEVLSDRCISYYTIEKKLEIPESARPGLGSHVFGCDICQDVCPWNRRAPATEDQRFYPRLPPAPALERLARITETEFRELFRQSPLTRTKYTGFLRNVAIAMGNSRAPRFRPVLESLARHENEVVASHARWALQQLESGNETPHSPDSSKAEV